jgi:hypothetical protein
MSKKPPEKKLVAMCMSRMCSTTNKPDISRTIKSVPFSATECPDCKSILVWKKMTEKMIAVYAKPKKV